VTSSSRRYPPRGMSVSRSCRKKEKGKKKNNFGVGMGEAPLTKIHGRLLKTSSQNFPGKRRRKRDAVNGRRRRSDVWSVRRRGKPHLHGSGSRKPSLDRRKKRKKTEEDNDKEKYEGCVYLYDPTTPEKGTAVSSIKRKGATSWNHFPWG